MSLNRYACRRDKNEAIIISAFELAGATVCQIDQPCDLLVGFKGHSALVEVKTEEGKLTETQRKFIGNWKGAYLVVRTVEQALSVVKKLRTLDRNPFHCAVIDNNNYEVMYADPTNDKKADPRI